MGSETAVPAAAGATAGAAGLGRRIDHAADLEAMLALGERLGRGCTGGGVIYLVGDLGTGKTTLVRGMLRGLGHRGPVRSPTFTLVEPYALGALDAYHLDLYRLGDPEELEYLGLRDYLEPGVLCLVEWPERGLGHLPPPDLTARIEYAGGGRRIELTADTPAGQRILDQISMSA
jgi:tRNA threonylcarbamoyladenosine biosynthesis protein TsaE